MIASPSTDTDPATPRAGVRARLKHAAERLATGGGLARAARARMRGGTLLLAYHNVVPRGEAPVGDLSLHLARDAFAAQLDRLMETHDVVPLADAVRLAGRRGGRPRVAITFDDAYRGAVTAGVAELAARGLPATIFVVPGRVGGGSFWWDALGAPAAFRGRALTDARGEDGAVRRLAREIGSSEIDVPPHALPASEDELRAAADGAGITFGSHTWSHPNLAALSADEVERELRDSLDWLRARFPSTAIPWLSYPYGLASPAVARAAAAAGYEGALRVEGGWMRGAPADRFAVPRLNVAAGVSLAGFELRAAGVLGR